MNRHRRTLVAAALVAAALAAVGLTACGSGDDDASSAAVDRKAGLFYNELRLCVQNQTSGNIEEGVGYGNDGTLVDGNGVEQDRFTTTLGPQATACFTTKTKLSYPAIRFQLGVGGTRSDVVEVSSSNAGFSAKVAPDDSLESQLVGGLNKQKIVITPGQPFAFTLDQLPATTIAGYTSGELRTYPNLDRKAYQIDLRIVPA